MGPHAGAGGSRCVEAADNVSQCDDVNTEPCVHGAGGVFWEG